MERNEKKQGSYRLESKNGTEHEIEGKKQKGERG